MKVFPFVNDMGIIAGSMQPTEEQLYNDALDQLSFTRRAVVPTVAGVGGSSVGEMVRKGAQQGIGRSILNEYAEIRADEANREAQMAELQRTYVNYLNKTKNPIEYFLDKPNYYAALTTPDGQDAVYFDSTAPQNSHFAHELGHIAMNHSTDPISYLQTSGIGRQMHNAAPLLGGAGATIGFMAPGKRRMAGAALGGLAGVGLSTPNTIYELEASRRGAGYIDPNDTSLTEYLGDVIPAGTTYALAGPGKALVSAIGTAGLLGAVRHLPR